MLYKINLNVGTRIYSPASQSLCQSRTPRSRSISSSASCPSCPTSSPHCPGAEESARLPVLSHLTNPWPGGCPSVWCWQAVFVVIRHPQSFLSSYCGPPQPPSTDRQGLEVRGSVRRDIRGRLGDFLNLKLLCFIPSSQIVIELYLKFSCVPPVT